MEEPTPSERYARGKDEVEIGATRGRTHAQVLEATLGHERGLGAATGAPPHSPVVEEGGETMPTPSDIAKERAHEEITRKKLERHGDLGGEK